MDGLDSNDPDWYAEALARWDGNLRSVDHGIERVNLTIEDQSNPRIIIEPGYSDDTLGEIASKLFYTADLRIVNGVATDSTGAPVSLVDPVSGDSVLRPTVIFDRREDHEMLTLELDVDKLGNLVGFPANGTVYIAGAQAGNGLPTWAVPVWVDTGGGGGYWSTESWPSAWSAYPAPWQAGSDTEFAVKLTNGKKLPAPLTIVTDNPAYIRGDYNKTSKKAAAVMADAITLLSNNWGRKDENNDPVPGNQPDDDLGYSNLTNNQRRAASTTYNVAIAFGAIEGTAALNNGGLENAMRFMERWSSRTVTLRGSFVVLWYPVHAYSPHQCCGYVYRAPIRDFSFDTDFLDLNNLPPSTPTISSIRVTNWNRS